MLEEEKVTLTGDKYKYIPYNVSVCLKMLHYFEVEHSK